MQFQKLTLLIIVLLMAVPMAVLAQETTPEPDAPLSLLEATAIVQAEYGDALILEIQWDAADDDSDESACWKFEFADGTELCVDALTGEITVDDDSDDSNDDSAEATPEPESTPDPNAPAPVITMEEAIAKALEIFPDGVVSKIELELWGDGTLVWEVKLDGDKLAVELDAVDGTVYDFGYDDSDDDEGDEDSYNGDSDDDYSDDSDDSDDSSDDSSDDHDDDSDDDDDDHDDDDDDDDDDHDDDHDDDEEDDD